MTRLYLVRHGETEDNARHIMQGQTPGKLNARGIAQAEDVARQMASASIDVFVASDLKRSIDTCRIIAQPHHKDRDIVTTELLRERDWGSFTGKFIPDLQDINDPEKWPKDIESLQRLKSRAQNFLTWLKVTYPGKTVLAVGHGIINKAIQSVYFKKPMHDIRPMTNAEVRVIEL